MRVRYPVKWLFGHTHTYRLVRYALAIMPNAHGRTTQRKQIDINAMTRVLQREQREFEWNGCCATRCTTQKQPEEGEKMRERWRRRAAYTPEQEHVKYAAGLNRVFDCERTGIVVETLIQLTTAIVCRCCMRSYACMCVRVYLRPNECIRVVVLPSNDRSPYRNTFFLRYGNRSVCPTKTTTTDCCCYLLSVQKSVSDTRFERTFVFYIQIEIQCPYLLVISTQRYVKFILNVFCFIRKIPQNNTQWFVRILVRKCVCVWPKK